MASPNPTLSSCSSAAVRRRRPSFAALGLALAVLALGPVACAEESGGRKMTELSWMTVDADAQRVEFDWISGYSGENGAWNYNGYYGGNATVVVPVGWRAKMTLTNQDGEVPHSMLVTKPYKEGEFPLSAGRDQVAIPRAYTLNPEQGLFAGHSDNFSFSVDEPAKYYLLCGVPGHAQSDMWIHLEISDEAEAPYVLLAEGAEGRT